MITVCVSVEIVKGSACTSGATVVGSWYLSGMTAKGSWICRVGLSSSEIS